MDDPTREGESRVCPRCNEPRAVDDFAVDRHKASGRKSHCKRCDKTKARVAYYRKRGLPVPTGRPSRGRPKPTIPCETCGGIVTGQGRRFCSSQCANNRARTKTKHTCEICDTSYHSKVRGSRYCSRSCQTFSRLGVLLCDLPLASCPHCRKTIVLRGRTSCGSARCYHALTYQRGEAKPCETCGSPVPSRQGAPRWCSASCYRRSPGYRDQRQRTGHRRRARKRGVTSEHYKARDIFERDGWLCHICERPIDLDARCPSPLAPTIDHLVPLARGGNDTRTNVKAAHFLCNATKGDRGGGEQLLLIG